MEKMRNDAVAYSKGIKAFKTHKRYVTNPYGCTKRELQSWWNAGYIDAKNNDIDVNMLVKV